ncbi:hypothetical protein BLOT_003011 [Blomia tropicalis]|nr:hypothetical protein BLOT_003011 [Blomia tropicalis]
MCPWVGPPEPRKRLAIIFGSSPPKQEWNRSSTATCLLHPTHGWIVLTKLVDRANGEYCNTITFNGDGSVTNEAAIGNSFERWYTQQQKPLKSSVTNDYNQTDSLPRIPPFAILFFRCNATVEESLHFAPLTTRPICVDKVHFLKLYYEKRKAISAASVK